ncbi:MAG: hypothetical protein IIA45_11115 [Bacteroidetes bacterium]|nr:hypothetical protein [Bacteroidota bacterium]
MKDQDKKHERGFNHGYLLSKYLPMFAKSLFKGIKSNNQYEQGLVAGKQEHEKERKITRQEELKQIRDKGQDQSLERDID